MTRVTLVANPGSASRKYAIFDDLTPRARLHFEVKDQTVACTLETHDRQIPIKAPISAITEAASHVMAIFREQHIIDSGEHIEAIGLRIVAPGGYFLSDHIVDDAFMANLESARDNAPLHVTASLMELQQLRRQFPDTTIIGVSDSAFHKDKPDHAWNYGLPLETTDRYELKRFGYHGLSIASVVRQLSLPKKSVICHLGGGVSVNAILNGKSMDTTMGYSPLEGPIMATRSGSIDISLATMIKKAENLDDHELELYLNQQSGLLGLGGSSDLRELLTQEQHGDTRARLAVETYVYGIQKAIGAMSAVLGGVDALVFTGTIGERSAEIRRRVIANLGYLGLEINQAANERTAAITALVSLQNAATSIYVVPANEELEITDRVTALSE